MEDEETIKELLRQVKKIELRSRRATNALTAGAYRSRFKGNGMLFEELREYIPGDDIRHIDWNVTARTKKPFIKVFGEERELSVMLLVDLSGSMRFGSIPGFSERLKLTAAAQVAAIIGVTALQNKDLLGFMGFTDKTEIHLPSRKGKHHTTRIIREILATKPESKSTNIKNALEELQKTNAKRSICFIVSDFLNNEEGLSDAIVRAGRKHDIIGLRISDPAEISLPKSHAPLLIQNPEGEELIAIKSSKANRSLYEENYKKQNESTRKLFNMANCELLDISTADNAVSTISRFFQNRRRRVK